MYELKHGEDTLLQGRIKYIVSQEVEEQKTKISLEGEVFEEGKIFYMSLWKMKKAM